MIEKIANFLKKFLFSLKVDGFIFNYFHDAFKITNNNIVLATPLMLFSIFIILYLVLNPINTSLSILFVLILFFAITAVFFSGWAYTIKLAIENNYSNKANQNDNSLLLLKQFPTGVGMYFLKFLLMVFIFFILFTIIAIITYKSALILIGNIGITSSDMFVALSSTDAMKNMILSLSPEQQLKLAYWNLYFFLSSTMFTFLLIFWPVEVILNRYSVLKAFCVSVFNLFRKFFKSLTIFLFLLFIYFIISLISALFVNQIINFIVSIIYFYYLIYGSILIFLFYKKEFFDNE